MQNNTSIKAAVFKLLTLLDVTPSIYYRELPQNPTYPATVYNLISDINTITTHDQENGPRQARMQIDVYALNVSEAENIIEEYYKRLTGYSGETGVSEFTDVVITDEGANPDKDFEDEPTLRNIEGRSRDFMIVY